MKNFLKPTKFTIILYVLFLVDAVHVLIGKTMNFCDQSMSFCAVPSEEILYIIISFILIPIKLLAYPFHFTLSLVEPIVGFIFLFIFYYIYTSFLNYLFTKKRKYFFLFIVITIITSLSIVFIMFNNSPKQKINLSFPSEKIKASNKIFTSYNK
jgi:hypothetical protein